VSDASLKFLQNIRLVQGPRFGPEQMNHACETEIGVS